MKGTIMALTLLGALIMASGAHAAYGDGFGVSDKAGGTAFPTNKALWAGSCDLGEPSTANGGYGSPPSPPPAHCIDSGKGCAVCLNGALWAPGQKPAWRLDPLTQSAGRLDGSLAMFFHSYPEVYDGPVGGATRLPDGEPRDIIAQLPPGLIGNPEAVPKCPSTALAFTPPKCPPETQVGVVTAFVGAFESVYPVWNVETRRGVNAELIFSPGNNDPAANIPIVARVRTEGDFGIEGGVTRIPGGLPVMGNVLTLWSVPWDPIHDRFRPPVGYKGGGGTSGAGMPFTGLSGGPGQELQSYDLSWGPIKPFTANPTECSGELLEVGVEIRSWQNPDVTVTESTEVDALVDGCEDVSFDPAFSVTPTSERADSTSGLDVELTIPQNNDLPFEAPAEGASKEEVDDYLEEATEHWRSDAGIATSHLKDTTVTLPEGYSINPAASNGQRACSSAQIGLTSPIGRRPITFNNDDPSDGAGNDCPASSKIGTATLRTPLLASSDQPKGEVYLAAQGDNPFGTDFAIYLVMRSPARGLVVKLAGEVNADPRTGRLSTTFRDNPPLPFESFKLRFKSGPLAAVATPTVCGEPDSRTELAPYSTPAEPDVILQAMATTSAANGGSCPAELPERQFSLGFEAGATNPIAAANSPFVARLTRPDGHQEVREIELTTPPGLAAHLRDVPYCTEESIARARSRTSSGEGALERRDPSCPVSSQVGTTTIGVGPGESPFYASGKAYLAGPYQGAPLSLAFVVPAIAGDFDLGVQVVRAGLHVNPKNLQITAKSDPIPTILRGIPLRIRDVRVAIDRSGFALNPTSCQEMGISATVRGASGATAILSNRFQLDRCDLLGFKPKIAVRLFGGVKRGDYPRLRATLDARSGDANISRASVTLGGSTFLAQEHLNNICTRVRFAADNCPEKSIYGYARAITPLLEEPVQGPVYLRSSDNLLPDLVAALRGPDRMPVNVELASRTDSLVTKSGSGRIRSTFDFVPDAPVTKFVLNMQGGKKSLLVNSRHLCAAPARAIVKLQAHNGRRHDFKPLIVADRCEKYRKSNAQGSR